MTTIPLINDKQYLIQTRMVYDGWGQISEQHFSDNTSTLQETDPVALRSVSYRQGGSADDRRSSGKQITLFDELRQLPLSDTLQMVSGTDYSTRLYQHDGAGRLYQETDELGNVT